MENRLSEIQKQPRACPRLRRGRSPSASPRAFGAPGIAPQALTPSAVAPGRARPRGETHRRGGPLLRVWDQAGVRGSRSRLGGDLSIRRSLVDSRASDAALTTRNCRVGLWCLPTLGEERSGRGSAGRSGRLGAEVGEPPPSGSKDCRCGLIARPRGLPEGKGPLARCRSSSSSPHR